VIGSAFIQTTERNLKKEDKIQVQLDLNVPFLQQNYLLALKTFPYLCKPVIYK
jgi:hypothetical protein